MKKAVDVVSTAFFILIQEDTWNCSKWKHAIMKARRKRICMEISA